MSEIRVDNITDEAGTGSPNLPNGLVTPSATVSGILDVASNIQLDSNGISFDSGSNYLDDYEEGTFNLVLTIGGSTGSTTLGSRSSGTYVKIGRLVFCTMRLDVDTIDTSLSGTVRMEGLPFPVTRNDDGNGVAGAHFRRMRGVSFSGQLIAGAGFGQNVVFFRSMNTNGTDTDTTETDIGAFRFEGSITYYTDP